MKRRREASQLAKELDKNLTAPYNPKLTVRCKK
jgi:hypothetical protein